MVFGRIDAINIVDLEMRLKRMDLDLVSGNQVDHQKLFGSKKIPRRELINFCFHLDQLARCRRADPRRPGRPARHRSRIHAFAKSSPA